MADVLSKKSSAPFELKSASMTLVALILKTTDLQTLAEALARQFEGSPQLLDHDPVIVDLAAIASSDQVLDVVALAELLRRFHLIVVGVRSGNPQQMADAREAGLIDASEHAAPPPQVTQAVAPQPQPGPTLFVDRPLRSGQQVYARGGDLVVMGMVSFGAELIADGNIHVYGPLRGKAIAGARGNTQARIFATSMEPSLIAIAGIYRTTESPLAEEVLGKPAQIWLDGESLLMEAIKC
ncbi:MAG: septum site-determining protein MinC [Leptothrix ochracea]|uniref:septum site-determining protein MinC n=1 Tax=Leptothrix ochracea TaxID=735331 RepID=UPI0034E2403B